MRGPDANIKMPLDARVLERCRGREDIHSRNNLEEFINEHSWESSIFEPFEFAPCLWHPYIHPKLCVT
jgi:hypothetical protein